MAILSDPASLRLTLLTVGVVLGLAYVIFRVVQRRKEHQLLEEQERRAAEVSSAPSSGAPVLPQDQRPTEPAASQTPIVADWSQILQERPSLVFRALRGALVLLALVVAAGFALILLPEDTIHKMAQSLQASKASDLPSERIALLYLGDEIKGKEFHIRGIVRNISNHPVENIDVMVRLYSTDGGLLETALVRMERDRIPPDDTAEFHLVYPNYVGQFGSYSVDFKLRQGDPVPYKDRRGAKHLY